MVDLELLKYLESFLTPERKNRFLEVLNYRTNYLTVVAEDVFQMHNASAIIRSCDVFGIQQAHVIEGRYGKRIDKNIALGAEQWVDVHNYNNALECVNSLRGKGYKIVATVPAGDAINLEDFVIEDKSAFFFGTEKEGLSADVLKEADAAIQIPMVGFSESLNVSVSAAIILHKISSDLRASELPWGLSEEKILLKRLDWARKTIKDSQKIIERYKSKSTR
ncbi:MAG: TrmH family RNA methyltransferase [Flavobacteriaceae bacterium]